MFEPDDELLWQAVTQQVTTFPRRCGPRGGLVGATAADAFVVTCDASNNPPDQILNGYLSIDIEAHIAGNPEPTQLVFTFEVESSGS